MFQSGEHQDDVWSYVAALHSDKAHPHVHMVVNNRGTVNDSWFFMAKEHVFNLDVMKERMVAIAAEEGIGALTDGHMKVVRYLREQQAKGAALTIRSMGKSGVVTTKELYDLFPGGPLKKSSKIAGIPKPVGCI